MKVRNNTFLNIIEILCVLILAISFLYLILNWSNISDVIPTHYGADGEADAYGSKNNLIFLPVINLIMYVFLSVVEKFPAIWNVGFKVTDTNKDFIYLNIKSLIKLTKLTVVLIFSYISFAMLKGVDLGSLFTLASILGPFVPTVYYITKIAIFKKKY